MKKMMLVVLTGAIFLTTLVILFTGSLAEAAVWSWVDEAGVTHYSNIQSEVPKTVSVVQFTLADQKQRDERIPKIYVFYLSNWHHRHMIITVKE